MSDMDEFGGKQCNICADLYPRCDRNNRGEEDQSFACNVSLCPRYASRIEPKTARDYTLNTREDFVTLILTGGALTTLTASALYTNKIFRAFTCVFGL